MKYWIKLENEHGEEEIFPFEPDGYADLPIWPRMRNLLMWLAFILLVTWYVLTY